MLFTKEIDVLAIFKTWLTLNVYDAAIRIDNYSFIRNVRGLPNKTKATNHTTNKMKNFKKSHRSYMQGGGVIVYFRNCFKAKLLAKSDIKTINETEFIILELLSDTNQRFLVAAVYRRPKGLVLNSFFSILFKFQHLNSNVIVLGDLNSDLLCNPDAQHYYYTRSLKKLINDYGFHNVPFGASHHHTAHGTWLDVILVDDRDKLQHVEKSQTPFINNHDYQIIDYKSSGISKIKKIIRARDFCGFDSELFKVKLHAQLALSTFSSNINIDPNSLLDTLTTHATTLLDTYAPLTNRKIRAENAPWMDESLRDRCKSRDKIYKRANALKNNLLLKKYRLLRKVLKNDIKAAREKFSASKLNGISDPKKKWAMLNRIGAVNDRKPSSPLDTFSASELNAFYASSVATAHPPCSKDELDAILSIPLDNSKPIFHIEKLSYDEVLKTAFLALPNAKGKSVDGLPLTHFRDTLCVMSRFMTDIYNTSLATAVYPDTWKSSLYLSTRLLSLFHHPIPDP